MYTIVDIDDPVEQEEQIIHARRLKQYGPAALEAGASVERIYVLFSEFKGGLEVFDRVFQLSKTLETPQGVLLSGPPGSSKTSLANYFIQSLPPDSLFEKGCGAIMLRLRASPAQGHVISALLHALKYPFTCVKRGRVFAMRDVAFEALKQRGTRIVFVDQAHCLSAQTRHRHIDVVESTASDTFREMMEEAKVGLVLLADSAFKGLEYVDRALDDRLSVKMTLSHFSDNGEWLGFLAAFVKAATSIDLQILNTERIAKATFVATDGNRRSFRRLIVEAVMIAVEEGQSAVSEAHLHKAFVAVNGRASPRCNPYAA